MRTITILLPLLLVGGCVSDGPGLSTNAPAAQGANTKYDPDTPKQVCVDTSEGTQGKTVCY